MTMAAILSHRGMRVGPWTSACVSSIRPRADSRRRVTTDSRGMRKASIVIRPKNRMSRQPTPTMVRKAQKLMGTEGTSSLLSRI